MRVFRRPIAFAIAAALAVLPALRPAFGQAPDDGFLLPKRTLVVAASYSHDSWGEYWEGSLKRSNDNIGTLTTQMFSVGAMYGLHDRVGLSMSLPFVRTEASQGILKGMSGIQDLNLSAKLRLLSTPFTSRGTLSAFIAATGAAAVGNYSPDLPPVSIGTSGQRASARFTLGFQSQTPIFVSSSVAYTFCANVRLDRPAYYTNGQMYTTNEVAMPNLVDYNVSAGYRKGSLVLPVTVTQQRTLGGGDIRRQDMPFISNRMDFTRVEAAAAYTLGATTLRISAGHVLNGRNVGQSNTFSVGAARAFKF